MSARRIRALCLAVLASLPAPALLAQRWAIPHFFEIGPAVSLSPGAPAVDTTAWVEQAVGRDPTRRQSALSATADDVWRIFTYPEVTPARPTPRRYALFLPRGRPCSHNRQTAACWEPSADAFNFGVEGSRTFANLAGRTLTREVHPLGTSTNVQAYQLTYAIGGAEGGVLREHKGLIPGVPVTFDRFRIEARAPAATLTIGLIPTDTRAWAHLDSLVVAGHRVLLATDARGGCHFLAAPLSLRPGWYFGEVASDLVVEAVGSAASPRAADQAAAALILPEAVAGTVLSGRVRDAGELAAHLARADVFLAAHDAALADLRARGPGGREFLGHYAHTFVDAHRSWFDPRALTAEPYGDHLPAINAPASSRGTRYGQDQARALLGLVGYQRRTGDPAMVDTIWGLAEASMEAMTPSGAVFRRRFDEMLVADEVDRDTGRADVFIDNGGVAVSFNHRRLVVGSAAPRAPGATWGAFSLVLDGAEESVDSEDYGFAVDAASIPETVRGDRESLAVARLFDRRDGTLRVRETVTLARGLPAARVRNEIENRGDTPRVLDEVRMTIGDFLDHGDGPAEASRNRYGLSALVEGVRQPVGLWMEGMREPLWGDSFAPGWVDLSAVYHQHRPRFVVVYAHGKAQVYYLPEPADQLLAQNVATGSESVDGYRGWTALQVRYRVARPLAPGATHVGPPVYSYLMRAPLHSADADTVPDVLQSLAPLWTDLLQAPHHHRLLHTTLEPDDASIALQAGWMAAADRLAELAAAAPDPDRRRELERRARLIRENALRGAEDSLTTATAQRGRSDLLPGYATGSNHGFHVLVFDWAYRMTGDTRFRTALLALADQIAAPAARGGLQVADPDKPNFGGYLLPERAGAQGASDLEDQGIKLWALRVAYQRTRDPRYRRSAELFIDHWIKIAAEDHRYFGITRLFDRYTETGPEQQMTPLGQSSLLIGLAAWADLHPPAARLRAEGLTYFTGPRPVDPVGITGVLDGGPLPGSNRIDFGTSADVGGTFLLALTFDPAWLIGRWPASPARRQRTRVSAVESTKG